MGLIDAIGGRPVYLDANVFIYALEGYAAFSAELHALFVAIDAGTVVAHTSQLTLAEVLVKPLADGNAALAEMYRRAVTGSPHVMAHPVDLSVLEAAAAIRSAGKVRLADAVHLATARAAGCGAFLTNDKRLAARRRTGPRRAVGVRGGAPCLIKGAGPAFARRLSFPNAHNRRRHRLAR